MPSPVRADRDSQSPTTPAAAAAGSQSAKGRWFGGLSNMFGQKPTEPAPPAPIHQPANALLAFPSESTPRHAEPPARERAANVPAAFEAPTGVAAAGVAPATVSSLSIAPSSVKASAAADVPAIPA